MFTLLDPTAVLSHCLDPGSLLIDSVQHRVGNTLVGSEIEKWAGDGVLIALKIRKCFFQKGWL